MMMPSLQRAAVVSFLLHMAFISLALVTIKRSPHFVMPSAYTVRLVSPGKTFKPARVPGEKRRVKVVDEAELEGVSVVQEPEKKVTLPKEKTPVKPAPKEDLLKYKEDRLMAIKAKKEDAEYREAMLGKIKSIKKIKRLKALGAEKGSVVITHKPAPGEEGGGPVSGGGASSTSDVILEKYYSMVGAGINNEWVFLDTGVGEIFATVEVGVLRDGTLVVRRFETKSGNAIFDLKAVRAINRASPVEPPPFEMELFINFYPNGPQ